MSDNHKEAMQAFQEAKDFRSHHKLLTKIMQNEPKIFARAWAEVDLVGHNCPVCRRRALVRVSRKQLYCGNCKSHHNNEGDYESS